MLLLGISLLFHHQKPFSKLYLMSVYDALYYKALGRNTSVINTHNTSPGWELFCSSALNLLSLNTESNIWAWEYLTDYCLCFIPRSVPNHGWSLAMELNCMYSYDSMIPTQES